MGAMSAAVVSANNNNNGSRCSSANNMQTTGRLKSSPNTLKHGPMKATIPMSSVLKQCSSTLRSSVVSPTMSPWKTAEVQQQQHSGLRSPGSTSRRVHAAIDCCIRRSASLDTIYLVQGRWPKENIYVPHLLQVDKATQTDVQDMCGVESKMVAMFGEEHDRDAHSPNGGGGGGDDDKLDKYIRQRMQRNSNAQHHVAHRHLMLADHTLNNTTSSQTNTSACLLPVNVPVQPLAKPTMRNSVEGLNQEIERLVLKSDDAARLLPDKADKPTPEGHRAPFPDLFRTTRSVNTQTPSVHDQSRNNQSASPPSTGGSTSPLTGPPGGQLNRTPPSDAGGSRCSTPDQEHASLCKLGTSPRLFLARGPPDGCERVNMRVDSKHITLASHTERPWMMPPHPTTTCLFQPSHESAFQRLQPPPPLPATVTPAMTTTTSTSPPTLSTDEHAIQ